MCNVDPRSSLLPAIEAVTKIALEKQLTWLIPSGESTPSTSALRLLIHLVEVEDHGSRDTGEDIRGKERSMNE